MAKPGNRSFAQGETIYREGDSADVAFIVASGRVELVRGTGADARVVRTAQSGQVFGESGMVEGGVREDTARALGPVTVDVLDRKAFLKTVRNKPEMALDVVGLLGKQLRAADQANRKAKAKSGPTIVQRLIDATGFGRSAQAAAVDKLDVRVAAFADDDGGALQKRIVAVLDSAKGVRARPLTKSFDAAGRTGARALRTLETQVRRAAVECACDVVVWGEIGDGGTAAVRFTSRAAGDAALAGQFGPLDALPLPEKPDEACEALLVASATGAVAPADARRRALQDRAFQPSLKGAIDAIKALPLSLTKTDRALVHVCFAHVTAHAAMRADGKLADDVAGLARQAYHNAISAMDGDEEVLPRVHKALACLLVSRTATDPDRDLLDEALIHLEAACDGLDRSEAARDWAACQEMTGTVLYRIDKGGDGTDGDVLRASLNAFQNALLVFTRRDAPAKWATLQVNVARVAQILGKHLHNPGLIERAIEACEHALSVRSRQRTPSLWASTQNNLGTALFLLAEMTGRDAAYTYAAEAFRAALLVYRSRGPVRMIAVVERNLARVEDRLAPPKEDRDAGLIDWSEIGEAADTRSEAEAVESRPIRKLLSSVQRAAAG